MIEAKPLTEVHYCPLTGDAPRTDAVIGNCARCGKVMRLGDCRNEERVGAAWVIVCYACLRPEED